MKCKWERSKTLAVFQLKTFNSVSVRPQLQTSSHYWIHPYSYSQKQAYVSPRGSVRLWFSVGASSEKCNSSFSSERGECASARVTKAVKLDFLTEVGGGGVSLCQVHCKLSYKTFQDVTTFEAKKAAGGRMWTKIQQQRCCRERRKQKWKGEFMTTWGTMTSSPPGDGRYVSTLWPRPASGAAARLDLAANLFNSRLLSWRDWWIDKLSLW